MLEGRDTIRFEDLSENFECGTNSPTARIAFLDFTVHDQALPLEKSADSLTITV